jgi:hypothetical protein
MSRDLISKSTRNEFRELLTGFVLREIDMIFESSDLSASNDSFPNISGARRTRVEQYYANIDFSSRLDVQKLISAYEEIIIQLDRFKDAAPQNIKTIESLVKRMERDGYIYENSRFISIKPTQGIVSAKTLVNLSKDSITEHIERANQRIDASDNASAITCCYTLIEELLKELLRRTGASFKESEGDIRSLYKLVAEQLNLTPNGESLESYLKAILEGLKQQISGLYTLANKASDRHARVYTPSRHHAKLAVNATFTLCEFLLDSYEYQIKRARKNSGEAA